MNAYLTSLGVPAELQAFFQINELVFNYGNSAEYFGPGFHQVPTTTGLWHAGSELAFEVIITASAMEAIAFLTINQARYPSLENLAIFAIGNIPHPVQMERISTNFKKRKFTLVFSNDLLGSATDIVVAAGLGKRPVKISRTAIDLLIEWNGKARQFNEDSINLYAFERAFGLRSGVRTRKPKLHITFLQELIAHANR